VSPQIERDKLVVDKKVNLKTKEGIGRVCDEMIDLSPHLDVYVGCFASGG
jgi:hypothetical protein